MRKLRAPYSLLLMFAPPFGEGNLKMFKMASSSALNHWTDGHCIITRIDLLLFYYFVL